jgi:hypothetical protein
MYSENLPAELRSLQESSPFVDGQRDDGPEAVQWYATRD